MVSGKTLPGGDPYLQRQNEPSLAMSSRNARHLVAGANDYRTVDIPGLPDGSETGDSWLSLFKSFDGGETWQSTLIPGYPQDTSPQGLASPLHGYTAGADPVVRAGTHGLFYYSGIVFNRVTNQSRLHVSTLIDLNNKENGDVATARDPIQFAGTVAVDTGNSGQFLDKPWLAVDIPRAGARTRTFNVGGVSQTVPCGNVYLAWAEFVGSQHTKILVSRSQDCGLTWSTGTKVSEGNLVNQGASVTVGPDGTVYVVWRRFATSSEGDAILFVKSTDCGDKFSKPAVIAPASGSMFLPFDQASNPLQSPYLTAFRTNSYPTIAASANGRVHVAWAQRPAPGGFARIVMAVSTNGGTTWSAPAAVDDGPLTDDTGGSFDRGHQFMPALTSRAGRLMLLYYDTRLDHTAGKFEPTQPYPDNQGRFYLETREPVGQADLDADAVHTPTVDDANLTERRHTIDVRLAQLNLCTPGASFATARASRAPFGVADFLKGEVQQLKFNPPNLPLFGLGKIPFVGDYIDIAGSDFTVDAAGNWSFNSACGLAPVFQAAWTSNEDVKPPPDGIWANYTPVGKPGCDPDRVGMRNQNVYSGRVTEGLLVSSPQTAKPLKPFDGTQASVRAFVVLVQNLNDTQRTFRLHVANQPAGGKASFIKWTLDGPAFSDLDVDIGPGSGVSRPVFATSTDPSATIRVEVTETSGGGLAGFVVLNADPTNVPLSDPDGGPAGVNTVEIYTPSVSNPSVYNPSVYNPSVSNPSVSNPSVYNPSVYNPSVSNPSVYNPSVSNPSVYNSTEANPSVSNPSVYNSALVNAPISDASYAVTNGGNTAASYRVQLVGDSTAVLPGRLQLLVTKNQLSPTSDGCSLVETAQSTVLANVANPPIVAPGTSLGPELEDSAVTNTTFSLRPGETGYVTLRGPYSLAQMGMIASAVAPAVIPHPTDPSNPEYTAPLAITSNGTLPEATFGVPYSADLAVFGGQTPYVLSASGLPAGLVVGGGFISGTPAEAGTFTPTVVVTDAAQPMGTTVTRSFSLTVAKVASATSVASSASSAVFGQPVTFTATVTGPMGAGSPTGTVTFFDGSTSLGSATLAGGQAALSTSSLAIGSHPVTAQYAGDQNHLGSTSAGLLQTVSQAATTTAITDDAPDPSFVGHAVTVSVSVSVAGPGAGAPSGTVTVTDGTVSCVVSNLTATTPATGSCSLTFATAGTKALTAVYSGSGDHAGSTSASAAHTVIDAATTTTLTSARNPSAFCQPVTFTATVTGPAGAGVPTGTVTFKDGNTALGTVPLNGSGGAALTTSGLSRGTHTITAVYSGGGGLAGSTSAPLVQTVGKAATTTTLTSSPNPSLYCKKVTFTAAVTGPAGAGTPTGTVTFKKGSTPIGTGTLNASGVATFSTTSLPRGRYSITAVYGGSSAFEGSTSAPVTQTVN